MATWLNAEVPVNRVLFGIAAAVIAASSPAQSLNVRLGGWDMTMTAEIKGAPRVNKFKTCLTKEDIDSNRAFQKDDDCTNKLTTRTATRWVGTTVCKGDQPSTGTFEIEARNPETIAMKATKTPGNVVVEMSGRWASASCKGYED
jgi:Protein of unknown function (DUF3617)